jgi:hypothetical protein
MVLFASYVADSHKLISNQWSTAKNAQNIIPFLTLLLLVGNILPILFIIKQVLGILMFEIDEIHHTKIYGY